MIKNDLKCPKCGKTLLRAYSMAVRSVTCKCGRTIDLKFIVKEATDKND